MSESSPLMALEQALKLEEEGHRFYLEAVQRATDTSGQSMFRTLAADEQQHLELVRRLISIPIPGRPLAFPARGGGQAHRPESPLFPKGKEALARVIREEATELEALIFALDMENRSFDLYRRTAEETQDETGKAMYLFLAGTEMEHFNTVMQRYELLTGRY